MCLVFKENVNGAATHALIVGVSDYQNLPTPGVIGPDYTYGFKKLASPAISAHAICDWLISNRALLPSPLSTVRLLACPSLEEVEALQKQMVRQDTLPPHTHNFLTGPTRPDFQNFAGAATKWWEAACSNEQNVTVFYFAGHGIQQTKDGAILLLDDFGQPIGGALDGSVDLKNIVLGMAPSSQGPNVARTQFYFVDACREDNAEISRLEGANPRTVFSRLNLPDERDYPIFFATASGAMATGRVGKVSYFCEALLHGLHTGCDSSDEDSKGNPFWPVTIHSLHFAIAAWFATIKQGQDGQDGQETQIDQTPALGGSFKEDLVISRHRAAPEVNVCISLDPTECVEVTSLDIYDDNGHATTTLARPKHDHPYRLPLRMGTYRVVANSTEPFAEKTEKNHPFYQRRRELRIRVT